MRQFVAFCLSLVLFVWAGPSAEPQPPSVRSPLSPDDAQAAFRLPPGLRIELVASEPQIESPVAMTFDENGRLWVVEMRDYPNGPAPGKPPEGRIKILEDRDGDGRYEHVTVFADNLLFANGLLPWKDGVLVTAAPNIALLRDTDGDGKADKTEVLYEGFAAQNPQLRVSHPVLGLDNWVHVANGLRGGKVKRTGRPDAEAVDLSGMDFRFDLLGDRGEAQTGAGQFGNTFDDWGNRFVCTNRNHLIPMVLPAQYVRRNPYLVAPSPTRDNQAPGGAARVFPLSRNWTTSTLHLGTFTAACGVMIYRGNLLPDEFRGGAFTCDPTGNLVHQEVLTPNGAGFRYKPPREGVEFLATPDDWCRPVSLAHGPDGALYVVDMYRAVIEHPEFMPPELKQRPDLLLGKDRGRIWRIVPEKHTTQALRPQLGKATTAELVALLEHPNAWQRTTAQRLLLQRQDPTAVEPLHHLLRHSKSPLGRLHAVGLLDGLNALTPAAMLPLLRDDHPRVREHAVRLAERWINDNKEIRDRLTILADDPDARVRFQVALTLGELKDDAPLEPLVRIALAGADDHWTRAAVASAVPNRAGALLVRILNDPTHDRSPGTTDLLREFSALVGARRDLDEVSSLLEALAALQGDDRLRGQTAALNGLAEGMGRRGTQLGVFLKQLPAAQQNVVTQVTALFGQAASRAVGVKVSPEERLIAVRLLAHAPWDTAEAPLTRLLTEDAPPEVRLAAVEALSAHPHPEVAERLLKPWPLYAPSMRRAVIEALTRRPERVTALLDAVESRLVRTAELDALRTRQLTTHPNAELRARASKLLSANLPAGRKEVLEKYQAALTMKGDAVKGKAVFAKTCAACHRIAGIGHVVGPDISDLRTKTPEMILSDVLNPNAAIDSNFVSYTVVTKSGKALTGLLTEETASSVTLRRADNQFDVVLRRDIEEIASTGQSLMPEGVEQSITIAEMADLIAYLKGWRLLDAP